MCEYFWLVSVLASHSCLKNKNVVKKEESPLIWNKSQIKHIVVWEARIVLLNLKGRFIWGNGSELSSEKGREEHSRQKDQHVQWPLVTGVRV